MKPIGRLLIVGNSGQEHVGAHFLSAARQLGLPARLLDLREAWGRWKWLNRLSYHLLRHRPARLRTFSRRVVEVCREDQPELLLVTGVAAPDAGALRQLRGLGVRCVNFLTDDPWNPGNGAAFFWTALREYDVIFSPRRANLEDLRQHGCRRAAHLPFGYNPELHFPERSAAPEETEKYRCDVAMIGGADADRVPLALALAGAGLKLKVYGGYWDRHPNLKTCLGGEVLGRGLRLAVSGATVNLCMVRKANRDGHAMRSLELPAMGGCLAVEDTLEHRELFGQDGDCVEFYAGLDEMTAKVKALCARPERARALGERIWRRICHELHHTYADRLRTMLGDRANE